MQVFVLLEVVQKADDLLFLLISVNLINVDIYYCLCFPSLDFIFLFNVQVHW